MEETKKSIDYQLAYKYAETMDWHIDGDINVDYYDIIDLAADAAMTTKLPEDVLIEAMVDYLRNELGYEV